MPTRIHTGRRRPARVYLREWLDYRNLTAEQLAGQLETSKSVVSKLMTGKQRYNHDWLEQIAFALNCEVPDLYRDPDAVAPEDMLRNATPEQRRQAFSVIEALLKPDTGG